MLKKILEKVKENKKMIIYGAIASIGAGLIYWRYISPIIEERRKKKIVLMMKNISKKLYPIYCKMALITKRVLLKDNRIIQEENLTIEERLESHYQYRYALFSIREKEIVKFGFNLWDIQEWLIEKGEINQEVSKLTNEEKRLKNMALEGKTPIIYTPDIPEFMTEGFVLNSTIECSKILLKKHIQCRKQIIEGSLSESEKSNKSLMLLFLEVEVFEHYISSLPQFKNWENNFTQKYHPLNYFENAKSFFSNDNDFMMKQKELSRLYNALMKRIYGTKVLDELIDLEKKIEDFGSS